ENAPGGWQNHDVIFSLAAAGMRPAGGTAVQTCALPSVDSSGAYTVGTSVLISAPNITHANDGTHTIDYYSTDKATNSEPVKHARSEERRVGKESNATGGNQDTNDTPFTIPHPGY